MLALSVALVITFLLLIKNIHSVSREGILHKRQVASAALDLSYIDYWMTFEYLNTVFKLPDSYLQQQLNITNSRYPRLSIARYASSHKIKRAAAIAQVKQLISNYLATQQQ